MIGAHGHTTWHGTPRKHLRPFCAPLTRCGRCALFKTPHTGAIATQFVVPEAFQWEAGDQVFLNSYFSDRFHVLPNTYNLWAGALFAAMHAP